MLGEIETRLQASGHAIANAAAAKNGLIATAAGERQERLRSDRRSGQLGYAARASRRICSDRGDEHLAKFLMMQQLFTEEQVGEGAAERQQLNKNLSGQALAVSLLEEICRRGHDKLEKVALGADRPHEIRLCAARVLRRRSADRADVARASDAWAGCLFRSISISRTHHGGVLQSVRRGGTRSGPAVGRLHRDVVSGPAGRDDQKPADRFTGSRAGPNRMRTKQIFRENESPMS